MRIKLEELKRALDTVLAVADEIDVDEVELDADLYWTLPPESRYDVPGRPEAFDMGQLSFDWDAIESDLLRVGDKGALWWHLVPLGNVLVALGETVNPVTDSLKQHLEELKIAREAED